MMQFRGSFSSILFTFNSFFNRGLRNVGVSGQLEMYSGQQSDQCPSANSGREFSEANRNTVTMHQKMGYNSGPYGFGPYNMGLEERPGLYQSSSG